MCGVNVRLGHPLPLPDEVGTIDSGSKGHEVTAMIATIEHSQLALQGDGFHFELNVTNSLQVPSSLVTHQKP
jgi:hypothetical protein